MIISGKAGYEFSKHDAATSTGKGDAKSINAPDATYGTIISVENAPVRVTFDNRKPEDEYGILLPPGVHSFHFANDITFASASDEPATISVVWLKGSITNDPAA